MLGWVVTIFHNLTFAFAEFAGQGGWLWKCYLHSEQRPRTNFGTEGNLLISNIIIIIPVVVGVGPWSPFPLSSVSGGEEEGAALASGLLGAGSVQHVCVLQAILWLSAVQEYWETTEDNSLDTIPMIKKQTEAGGPLFGKKGERGIPQCDNEQSQDINKHMFRIKLI